MEDAAWDTLNEILTKESKDIDELVQISKQYDNMATVKKMKEIVPEYKSKNSEYEVLDVK